MYNLLSEIKQVYHSFMASFQNNHIYLVSNTHKKKVFFIKGLTIRFTGYNAKIEVGKTPTPRFINSTIECGENTFIKIESSQYSYTKLIIISYARNSSVIIGENTSCEGCYISNSDESNLKIIIGKECMIATNVYIRNSDGHTILDKESNTILNKPSDLIIGDKVWICNQARILKNTIICEGSIVGNASLVNKPFTEKYVILAGVPAKIVKKNILWHRVNTEIYSTLS